MNLPKDYDSHSWNNPRASTHQDRTEFPKWPQIVMINEKKKIVVVLECISWSWNFYFHRCALQPFMKERHGLDATVTLSRDPWANKPSCTFLNKTWPAAQWRIAGQHVKKRSSFINCEVEFSAKNPLKPACLRVGFKCGNMLIISNFNDTNGCALISCLEKNIKFWKKQNDSK